jgi:hypothetical protein
LLALLTLLTLLTALLALLSLLSLLTLLAAFQALLAALSRLLTAHSGLGLLEHLAEALDVAEGLLHGFIVRGALAILTGGHELLDFLDLVAEGIEALGDLEFGHQGILAHSVADPGGVALHVASEVGLLHLAERLAELGGGLTLAGLHVAGGVLHVLLEALQVADFVLPLPGELLGLVAGEAAVALRGEGLAELVLEILLFAGEVFSLLGEVVHLVGGLLAAQAL